VNTKRSGKWSNSACLNIKSHYLLYMYDHNIALCSRMIFLQYPIITPDLERNADTKREREREKKNTSNVGTRTAPPTGQCSVFSAIVRNCTSAFTVPTSRTYLRERVRPHCPSRPYPYYWRRRRRNIFIITTDNNTWGLFNPASSSWNYLKCQLDATR
jgi:hypothetical protein